MARAVLTGLSRWHAAGVGTARCRGESGIAVHHAGWRREAGPSQAAVYAKDCERASMTQDRQAPVPTAAPRERSRPLSEYGLADFYASSVGVTDPSDISGLKVGNPDPQRR